MAKTDIELKQDIEQELRWDPKVNAAQIGVSVDAGVVSLLGTVDTYAEKWAAEDATRRVSGVRTVAQDLAVKLPTERIRSDLDIAAAIQTAFSWNVHVPKTVTATVQQGWVQLSGQVAWNYQRNAAEQAVRHLEGVVNLSNLIGITPQPTVTQVKAEIEAALQRRGAADAHAIHIETCGGKVTLTGHASSWGAIEEAANAAWAAPGVTEVIDQVTRANA